MFGLYWKSQYFLWIKLESWNKWTPTHITNFSWQKEKACSNQQEGKRQFDFSTLQQPIRIIFKINKKETHNLIFQPTTTKSKFPQKFNNPHSLKHSNKHVVSNNSRDNFWEQKSPKFNAPYTNIIKKNYPAQKRGGIEQETKSNMAEHRERERERTCVSAGSTVGFGPSGFSSILAHSIKAATGPHWKPPWLFRINGPLLSPFQFFIIPLYKDSILIFSIFICTGVDKNLKT